MDRSLFLVEMMNESLSVDATQRSTIAVSASVGAGIVIGICADDYGVDKTVNDAIVDLGYRGRLSATSVLVDGPELTDVGRLLSPISLDVGLHLNFTDAIGDLSVADVLPLGQLIVRAHARLLNQHWVRQGIQRQLDRFEVLFGRAPDYVDGHLHIHQLPIIRETLVESLNQRYGQQALWIRDTRASMSKHGYHAWAGGIKPWVIGHLGMATLVKLSQRHGWLTNRGFAGVYDFTRPHPPYNEMLRFWCSHCENGALIMTHPSTQAIAGDPIGQSRVEEYKTLASDEFGQYLQESRLYIERPSQLLSGLP